MLEYTRCFFDVGAAVFRAGFQDFRELSLADDNVHLTTDTGIGEQLLDVHEARFGAVDLVFARTIPEHAARDGYFRVLNGQSSIGVIDGEGNLGAT